jgi:hypothetical protein
LKATCLGRGPSCHQLLTCQLSCGLLLPPAGGLWPLSGYVIINFHLQLQWNKITESLKPYKPHMLDQHWKWTFIYNKRGINLESKLPQIGRRSKVGKNLLSCLTKLCFKTGVFKSAARDFTQGLVIKEENQPLLIDALVGIEKQPQVLSFVEKAESVQVRFRIRLRDQSSLWMQGGCRVYIIPTWHPMDHVSWSLGLFSKTTSWR